MKIVMIYDQIQAGAGTKDDKMIGLNMTQEVVGPAVMMENYLKEIDGNVIATLYCGNGYYIENKEEVIRKLTAMVAKIQPDIVMCGPAFNYLDFGNMCAEVTKSLQQNGTSALAAMSVENESTIENFKDDILIVKTPKKGGVGLNDSLKNMCKVAKTLVENKDIEKIKNEVCF